MAAFLFVHGAWHGAWCWDKVTAELKRLGHTAIAMDVPGHGADKTPLDELSFDGYAEAVAARARTIGEPIVLVGHSLGGTVISQAAELAPNLFRELVYVTAFLLQDGQGPADVPDPDSLLYKRMQVSKDRTTYYVNDEDLVPSFYHDCPDEDVDRARRLLRPEPWNVTCRVHISNERFGSVPRAFVECLNDHSVTIKAQRAMQAALPCHRVVTMHTGHSPFFAAPHELTAHLASIVGG